MARLIRAMDIAIAVAVACAIAVAYAGTLAGIAVHGEITQ
jgi:hypothetical protein